ncbi:MAG: hypothetical protein GX432_07620 [Candidatus Atribacteria bacterium]|nr:hypothetical protein [Candidatus Atribacteria bacterium]
MSNWLRVAFVYLGKDKALQHSTRYMIHTFEKSGHTVKAIEIEDVSSPINLRPYDIIFVGASVVSAFGGKISPEVVNFLKGVVGMEGKKTVAYVRPSLFGTDKALRRLMANMESSGAFVIDFQAIKSDRDAQILLDRQLKKG